MVPSIVTFLLVSYCAACEWCAETIPPDNAAATMKTNALPVMNVPPPLWDSTGHSRWCQQNEIPNPKSQKDAEKVSPRGARFRLECGALRQLLEMRALDVRLLQVLRIGDLSDDRQPDVTVRRREPVVVLGDAGVG